MSTVLSDERIFRDIFVDTLDCKKLNVASGAELKSLKVGSLTYPDSAPEEGTLTVKGGKLQTLSKFLCMASSQLGQAPNDHVQFDQVMTNVGSNITVDLTSAYTTALNVPSFGRITLKPGKYHLRASVLEHGTTGTNGVNEVALRNADSGDYFNPTGLLGSGTDRSFLTDETVVTVTVNTRVDFTIVFATTLSTYGKAFISIEQLA